MAAISNARDLILQATVPRLTVTAVTIVPEGSGFLKDKNVLALSPATLNLTTILVGFTAAATYNWYYASSLNPNTFTLLVSGTSYTSYSITNTAFLTHVGLGTSVVYKCKVTQPGWADAETTTTINYTKRANDIPVATLNKTSIVLPTSAADVVNYANSDSSITVSIGGVNIPYAASGSNSFSVETAITSGTVTVGAATTSTNIVTNDTRSFSVLSGMAAGNAPATITYTVSARDVDGVATLIPLTQTITKVTSGTNGTNGTRTAVLDMYRWSATIPTTFPSGTSTYTWSTAQFTNPATLNTWSQTPGAGAEGQTLYIVSQTYADTNTTTTSSVTWTANSARIVGVYGSSGLNGSRTAFLEVYQWAATTPTGFPSGTSTYTWATGSFTAPGTPNGWSLTPGASSPGFNLYACSIRYSDTLTVATTVVTWTTSVAYVVGSAGTSGTNGTRTAVLDMYLWSFLAPAGYPSGTSTYTWATGQFTNPATLNTWSQTPGSGAGGQTLYIVSQTYADTNTTATSSVTWTANSARIVGVYGSSGLNGSRTAFLEVYQWAATTPTGFPSGTSTYTWATGSFTAPGTPNGWSLTPGASSPGFNLYACSIRYSDTLTAATTVVTWTTNVAYVVGSAGTNGSTGSTGATGTSNYRIYIATASSTATPATPSTTIDGATPASWSPSPVSLTGTQAQFQSDGVRASGATLGTANTTWGTPYLSYFKVATLEAITASMGSLTSGTITGATIRTAASGSRVELNASDLKVYSGASAVLTIGPGVGTGGITSQFYNYTANTSNYFDSTNSVVGIDITGTNRLSLGTANSYIATSFAPGATNTYELGGTGLRWQNIYTINAVTVGSDARLKTNIETSVLGLNFINALNPVSYKLIQGSRVETGEFEEITTGEFPTRVPIYQDVPGVRKHYGLIAQEVKVVLDTLNTGDFAGFVLENKDDPNSLHSLRYEEFISPLIKAVQELSAKITALENRLNS